MPRRARAPRRLVADGREYRWVHSHSHRRPNGGPPVDCRQTLTLTYRPGERAVSRFRIVFDQGPGRYVPGGGFTGSGDVGFVRGAGLNLHEPGAVRALLQVAMRHGWQPDVPGGTTADGWSLLEEAAALRERELASKAV
ncbi:hypothetical protein [Streptomyces fragilis]|uniref:Uncharacterized protein n=1 Tax=Streptomyces fragilis TaxID=67301 RepID=A0ABV2YL34_9ACTN|nr:hypothetical protein [Streptomyces fragilis]